MHIGFTGTQSGMTKYQKMTLESLLRDYFNSGDYDYFHHGDCIGADAEAHDIAIKIGYYVIVHPSTIKTKRAFKKGYTTRAAKPPLERNKDIVDESDTIIACPKEKHEVLRSGTWATIRYVRQPKNDCKEFIKIPPEDPEDYDAFKGFH